MLLWIIVLLVILGWGGGFAFHVGGSFIHLLLVLAVILIIFNVLQSRSVL